MYEYKHKRKYKFTLKRTNVYAMKLTQMECSIIMMEKRTRY